MFVPNPSTLYELIRVELISEADAGGATVANCTVLDKEDIQTGERVYLAWPFPNLTDKVLPGNANGQHMITNGFPAHDGTIGPLALYVGDANGQINSDLIGGLGLPDNRHVCYRVTWRERGSVVDPGEPPVTTDPTAVVTALNRIAAALEAFNAHIGVPK